MADWKHKDKGMKNVSASRETMSLNLSCITDGIPLSVMESPAVYNIPGIMMNGAHFVEHLCEPPGQYFISRVFFSLFAGGQRMAWWRVTNSVVIVSVTTQVN